MRDEGVICVAGHPLLNRRCTRLPGCSIRLRNDLHCVGWGVKIYSLYSPAELQVSAAIKWLYNVHIPEHIAVRLDYFYDVFITVK